MKGQLKEVAGGIAERFFLLISKMLSRKGLTFVVSTALLVSGVIGEDVWFMVVAVILFDIGGQNIAGIIARLPL